MSLILQLLPSFKMYSFDIWNGLVEIFYKLVSFFVYLFPRSPVSAFVAHIQSFPYLGYLNWFLPIGTCVQIMGAWLVAIGGYYGVMIIWRFFKIVGA